VAVPGKPLAAAFTEAVLSPAFWDGQSRGLPVRLPTCVSAPEEVVDLDDLIRALIYGTDTGDTTAFKRGEPHPRGSVLLSYLDHATLALSEAELSFPALLELCQSLSTAFAFVSSRVVVDPPGSQAPPVQGEDDVLVLQLWGEQSLSLRRSVAGLPITAPRPATLMQAVLHPGDALFLPRRIECRSEGSSSHTAMGNNPAATGGPSLYVVFELRTADHSIGVSLGKQLNDALREEGALSKEADAFMRSAVTKNSLPDRYRGKGSSPTEARAELESMLQGFAAELAKQVSAAKLRKHFDDRMETLRKEQSQSASRRTSQIRGHESSVILSTSIVRVARGVTCSCTPGEAEAHFKRGTETLHLPIARSASWLINGLSDGKPHVVNTLFCEDPLERLCVCQVLASKSCLEVVKL